MPRKSPLHAPTTLGAALLATLTALACGSFKGTDAVGSTEPGTDGGSLDGATLGPDGDAIDNGKDASSSSSGTDAGAPFICTVTPGRVCDGFDGPGSAVDVDKMLWQTVGYAHVSPDQHVSPKRSLKTAVSGASPGTVYVPVNAPNGHFKIDLDYLYRAGDACKILSLDGGDGLLAALTIKAGGQGFDVSEHGATDTTSVGDVTPATWVHAHLDFTLGGKGSAMVGLVGTSLNQGIAPSTSSAVVSVGAANAGSADCAFYFDNVDINFD